MPSLLERFCRERVASVSCCCALWPRIRRIALVRRLSVRRIRQNHLDTDFGEVIDGAQQGSEG